MNSDEVLRQFIVGAMKSADAISELKRIVNSVDDMGKKDEAARARYAVGFIRRAGQFENGYASARDMCLNIRDIILVFGRLRLTDRLYHAVRDNGAEFGLIPEGENQVSCSLNIPTWLNPVDYIKEVYSLRKPEDDEERLGSAGDSCLMEHTPFQTYKSFEQKIAVHTALALPTGHTLLVSQPTGGGKSLITQLLAAQSSKLTLVIVPTVALTMDQFDAAKKVLIDIDGIYCYYGDQSEEEKNSLLRGIREHKVRLLFTSPEAILRNPVMHQLLDQAADEQMIANIVIDEAHIVPDWGVFFRPDFQMFSIALKKWKRESNGYIRTYLLSATLSDDVVTTLFDLFGSEEANIQVRCDALRQEPRFYFQPVKTLDEQNNKTIEAIKLLPKPMVVYVLEPREARDLQNRLRQEGYLNIPVFTGETNWQERRTILRGWKEQKYDVVIATSAFGIGVDKPDVRSIVHACCPENLSRFYQEVGRGGRDGLPSISLFMPYKSRYDGNGDVRRALGLVNKRVLTVERAVIRWNGMLSSPNAFVDGDECILDTSATPATMTDEEAEYAGNRNVAWNINLLLFLYRTGFIDLLDVRYVYDKTVKPVKQYYTVRVKMLQPSILGDNDRLREALTKPRENEYKAQMTGYEVIRDLVASPKAVCWGRVFKHLFPLSQEICHGCPADPEGRMTMDQRYKLRKDPDLHLSATAASRHLARNMGSFTLMIVKRTVSGAFSAEEVKLFASKVAKNSIGALVAPKNVAEHVSGVQLVLNYEEFYFAVEHCPYLFADGVACIIDEEQGAALSLFKNLEKLAAYNYRRILYCSDNTVVTSNGRAIRECSDGYIIPIEKL